MIEFRFNFYWQNEAKRLQFEHFWVFLTGIVMKKFLAGLLALYALSCHSAIAIDADRYIVVIDAGSSGSRLHLFHYKLDKDLPDIVEIFSETTKPGLSSFSSQPNTAGASLKPLFDDAMVVMQKNHIDPATVPVNLFATAGMRLLPEETQQAIYANVKQVLHDSYPLPLSHIETISGKLEGIYGWLDVNYLAGSFATGNTLGIIDMGGASTQIVFETADTSRTADEITLKIAGKIYHIFSKSFLGMGEDQALATINTTPEMNTCYPGQYPLSSGTGNFDYGTCRMLYSNFIQDNNVPNEILPVAQQKFIAYSGAYYGYHFFDLDQTPDQAVVEKRIQTVCMEGWEQMKKDYSTTPEKYLATYCANMVYISDLFYDAYQLQGSQLQITTEVNGHDIDGPLGALLYIILNEQNG
jgi:hypothetical protein